MKIGGLVEQCHLTMYTMTSLPDRPGAAAEILTIFGKEGINLEYITESTSLEEYAVISFCVDSDAAGRIDEIVRVRFEQQLQSIRKREYVCILGVYGPHFREKPGIAANFCTILGRSTVNILGMSSSISTISCVIDVRDQDRAREALLSYFELP